MNTCLNFGCILHIVGFQVGVFWSTAGISLATVHVYLHKGLVPSTSVNTGFLKGDFSLSLTKIASPVWVEDKVIKVHTPLFLLAHCNYFSCNYCNQSNCSIRESWSDCSIRVFKQTRLKSISKGGFRWNLETPWIHHWNADSLQNQSLYLKQHIY